jgi:enterobactin synthetase component D
MPAEHLLSSYCSTCLMTAAEVGLLGAPRAAAFKLCVAFPPQLDTAVASRQFEFVAGRAASQRALWGAGFRGQAQLPVSTKRRPVWPEGFVGSISHSQGVAWAAAASRTRLEAIGIDMEHLLEVEPAAELAPSVMGRAEIEAAQRSHLGLGAYVTLLFSAKESLYKCLNPLLDVEFGFHDILAKPIQADTERIELQLVTTLAPNFHAGREFEVRFRIQDGMAWTAVELLPS